MTVLFWLMALLIGLCGFAANVLSEYGGFIFFTGYFLATGLAAVVSLNQKAAKRQEGEK